MHVKYIGHDKAILADYNGKRYCFYRNQPVEISSEVYNYISSSALIEAEEFVVVEEKPIEVVTPVKTIAKKTLSKTKNRK